MRKSKQRKECKENDKLAIENGRSKEGKKNVWEQR